MSMSNLSINSTFILEAGLKLHQSASHNAVEQVDEKREKI